MINLSTKLDELLASIPEVVKRAEEVSLQTMLGAFLQRIFNEGKATDGNMIGVYSEKFKIKASEVALSGLNKNARKRTDSIQEKRVLYKQLRQIAGRQVQYVDLQFTDRLFKSIKVVELNDHYVLGFTDPDRAKIAHDNEIRFKKKIFIPTAEEIEKAKEAYYDYLREEIQDIFNRW